MKLIRPFTVTAANLTSNIAETGTEYAVTGNYALGEVVVQTVGTTATHHSYESLVASNVGNALTDAAKWLDLGPTNKFAMFDAANGTATTGASIDATVAVTGRADGLALLGMSATAARIRMVAPSATHTNLSTYSEDFTHGDWYKSPGTGVTANATIAPNGTKTADKIFESDTQNLDRETVNFLRPIVAGSTNTVSAFFKAAERTYIQIRLAGGNGTFSPYFANLNLNNGTIPLQGGFPGCVSGAATLDYYGNGWYKASITAVLAADVTQAGLDIYMHNGSVTGYVGVVNSGFYVWGVQLEAGSTVSAYIPTTSASVTETTSTVFDYQYDLQSDSGVDSWYDYFSENIVYKTDLVLTDLPLYTDPQVRAVITGTGTVSCGTMQLGQTKDLGAAVYGARAGIQDYSKKDVDAFGNYTIVPRAFAKRTSLKLVTDNAQIDELHAMLADYRTTPAVWIGTDDYACTWVFGFYKDFAVEIAQLQKSYLTLEIEGLT